MKSDDERQHERMLAAYNQNYEMFRSLNGLMWQIPLIAMTLTGGLWFGVSKVESYPWFQVGLLLLALAGNIGLIVVLGRLRFIMGCYLDWMRDFNADGHVAAVGTDRLTRSKTVRTAFQLLLGLAAVISFGLMLSIACDAWTEGGISEGMSLGSVAFYDRHAADLADGYEGVPFERAHPLLAERLRAAAPLKILDVGAGTGRDAAWMAGAGHQVIAVEPSEAMLRLARSLHADARVHWRRGALPNLDAVAGNRFDIIVLSAVWMHVNPDERPVALARLRELIAPGGLIYVTLRQGPPDRSRAMFETPAGEFERLAAEAGLAVEDLGTSADLMGRREVQWRTLLLRPVRSAS